MDGPAKGVLRALDHQAIYLLIAGTYTPFTLVALRGALGWWMFGAIWGLAGGIFYTPGILFFILEHWHPWSHGIWHLFVLAGSVRHYFTILLFL